MTTMRKVIAPRVLIIEDEPDLQEALVSYLNMEGILAHGVSCLGGAQAWMANHEFDIVLLDLGLPDGDGVEWLKRRQDLMQKGVIITTARSDGLSRVSGIRAGADVYLVKPVFLEEIVLLIHNLIRRLHGNMPFTWVLDDTTWYLFAPDGRPLKVTHSEQALLRRLAQSSGQAVSREDLVTSLGHNPDSYDYRRLEILVRRFRNKARESLGVVLPLETVHRQGYAFTDAIVVRSCRR